ncbi:MAG: EFR1 family ferrodoxin [Oscillospiraceae bacterium]
MLKNLFVAYFSPTGGTERAALCLAENLADKIVTIDLSLPERSRHLFGNDDVVLFAAPAFGGRIPAFVVEKLRSFQGNHATALTVIVYGNRAYDDALLELNDNVTTCGFRVGASAALIAEHSMSHAVATGRPDAQDEAQIRSYAVKILEKISSRKGDATPTVPGHHPYLAWKPMPVTPVATDACIKCGLCAEKCPTQAIPKQAPQQTDSSRCMLCLRCVVICPQQARALPAQMQDMLNQKLAPLQSIRHENELFL